MTVATLATTMTAAVADGVTITVEAAAEVEAGTMTVGIVITTGTAATVAIVVTVVTVATVAIVIMTGDTTTGGTECAGPWTAKKLSTYFLVQSCCP